MNCCWLVLLLQTELASDIVAVLNRHLGLNDNEVSWFLYTCVYLNI